MAIKQYSLKADGARIPTDCNRSDNSTYNKLQIHRQVIY